MKKWTEKQKIKVVERCDIAKNSGGRVDIILKEIGASSSQLCDWRKKFGKEKPSIKNVMKAFGVEPVGDEIELQDDGPEEIETFLLSSDCLDIPDEYNRDAVIVALVRSGYTVSQTVEDGHYFVNYERSRKQ